MTAKPLKKSTFGGQVTPKKTAAASAEPLPTLADTDPVGAEIVRRLQETLTPLRFTIQNDTEAHRGHKKARGGAGEHYNLFVVSELFEGLSRLQREKWVTSLLADMYGTQIHALSLNLKSPGEVPGAWD